MDIVLYFFYLQRKRGNSKRKNGRACSSCAQFFSEFICNNDMFISASQVRKCRKTNLEFSIYHALNFSFGKMSPNLAIS